MLLYWLFVNLCSQSTWSGVAGIVLLSDSEEKVVAIKKGDWCLGTPLWCCVTWWYNKEETELVILFLGDTSKAHKAGEFTDFFLTGSNGIFTVGFWRQPWKLLICSLCQGSLWSQRLLILMDSSGSLSSPPLSESFLYYFFTPYLQYMFLLLLLVIDFIAEVIIHLIFCLLLT